MTEDTRQCGAEAKPQALSEKIYRGMRDFYDREVRNEFKKVGVDYSFKIGCWGATEQKTGLSNFKQPLQGLRPGFLTAAIHPE